VCDLENLKNEEAMTHDGSQKKIGVQVAISFATLRFYE
jgi:hypothetical protein